MIKSFFNSKSFKIFKKGEKYIPGLVQTFAKNPFQFSFGFSPIFLNKGKGCYVSDINGNKLIDTIMGIGPLILGYNNEIINKAIKSQINKGIIFSLTNPQEVELAEILNRETKFDMFKFSKTGADVTSAAIRLSRAYNGREKILSCGYHGWHDWSAASLKRNNGVPQYSKKIIQKFEYNNLKDFLNKVDNKTAAVIMEPIIFEKPNLKFLKTIRQITKRKKIVLIFDEMWTGFRLDIGGASKILKIKPDLVCYSKAIANGMPISVLGGSKKIMSLLDKDVFFYTTFGAETLSISSAIATIKLLKKDQVLQKINSRGENLIKNINKLINKHNVNSVSIQGYGSRFRFILNDKKNILKTFMHEQYLQNNILWNGIITLSYSHKDKELKKIIDATDKILKKISKHSLSELNYQIKGKLIKSRPL